MSNDKVTTLIDEDGNKLYVIIMQMAEVVTEESQDQL